MDYTLSYILLVVGTLLVAFWAIIYLRYKNSFDNIIEAMDSKQFMMRELFFIGFGVIDMFKVNLKTKRAHDKQKKIAEIYGQKYSEFYHYCILGGQLTYFFTITPMGLFVGALANDAMIAVLMMVATFAIILSLDMDVSNAVAKKRDEVLSDYPDVLSKLTLLVNAGLVVREAWTRVAYTSDRALYKEMQITSEEINNGVAEIDAFFNFAQRCSVKEIRKFASVLTQNIQKGGSELATSLKFMNEESWEEKKHRAKRKGETASTKLLIPLMIMFSGILLMIVIPILTNLL